ncbi:TPA: hypothetical protein U1W10_000084 [Streptococcus suis]|nr:hypothetical protein [Streptococcus suis]
MIPKFRVWHKELERLMSVQIMWLDEGEISELELNDSLMNESIPVHRDDVILMRSTGLFDVNGKEIFEGDVLTFLDDDNNPIYENAVVKFGQHTNVDTLFKRKPVYVGVYVEVQKGAATFDVVSMYNDYEGRLTIIGNIYENPELVEEEND